MNETNNNVLAANTTLKERYEIKKYMGSDGLMNLYRGWDIKNQKSVMIYESFPWYMVNRDQDGVTVVPDEFLESTYPGTIERAKKNVEYMKSFWGEEGVLRVEDSLEENNTFYMITENVEVTSLQELLEKEDCFSLEETLEMLSPIMILLEKIHENQMIHREITPYNVYINKRTKKAFLVNFYTMRKVANFNTESTVYVCGGYTPLEQQSHYDMQGTWTDVYSLCAVIYECITGKKLMNVVDRLMEDSLAINLSLVTYLSKEEKEVLCKGLSIKPQDRIASIKGLREAFETCK